MQTKIVEIEVYDKRERLTTTIHVEQLSNHVFKAIENEIFNCNLTLGTEFETRLNKEGKHEIIRIVKKSDYITRRFMLNSQFRESEYRLLGDEIVKHGGFWQVDFGSIATINLPKECDLDIDEIFRIFAFKPIEIKD
jgi:hypothetical protein